MYFIRKKGETFPPQIIPASVSFRKNLQGGQNGTIQFGGGGGGGVTTRAILFMGGGHLLKGPLMKLRLP